MCNVAIPLPPVVSTALPPQALPINNLERMRMVAIPIPPSVVPAPNMDWLEQMHNATIPHPPSSSMEMMDVWPQPSSNIDLISPWRQYRGGHKPGGGARSWLYIGFWYSRSQADMRPALKHCGRHHAGDMPTLDEHQALEQPAEWYGNLCLDMEELDHLILVTISQESFSPLLLACFVFPWWVDRSPQHHADFQQTRGARIFPIVHEYFWHTWPLQQLSMGDQIDEWMEEKVSTYMITARSAAVVCLVKTQDA
ncbi:hypothetical protein EDD16DRAFT_1523420 [Pisolithus croceorrhizus]|nr:hypothetical protein EDD16DRAFT_1523420 [Pisolithus croceorrhizus]KAI6167842.1 hypothetical protein EDD17DRAFT_1504032 [Pisolithus thermaeus]